MNPGELFFPCIARLVNVAPPQLFHYTDQAGFLGIIKSRQIWASDLRYLNDAREYSTGFELITNALRLECARRNINWDTCFKPLWDAMDVSGTFGVAVASFSAQRDDLAQWRGYSRGSGGVALGFSGTSLAWTVGMAGGNIGRMIYEPEEQHRIVSELVESIVGEAAMHAEIQVGSPSGNGIYMSVQLACALLKDKGFSQENEWRVIAWGNSVPFVERDFRPGRSSLVPFAKLALDAEVVPSPEPRPGRTGRLAALNEVMVGPTSRPEMASVAVAQALFQDERLHHVLVTNSAVPFRDW